MGSNLSLSQVLVIFVSFYNNGNASLGYQKEDSKETGYC